MTTVWKIDDDLCRTLGRVGTSKGLSVIPRSLLVYLGGRGGGEDQTHQIFFRKNG